MSKMILFFFLILTIVQLYADACLITNCPRGGKRSEGYRVVDDKAVSIHTDTQPYLNTA